MSNEDNTIYEGVLDPRSILKQQRINPDDAEKGNYYKNFTNVLKKLEKDKNPQEKFMKVKQIKATDMKFNNFYIKSSSKIGNQTRTFDKSKFERIEQENYEKGRLHQIESLKEQVEEFAKEYEKLQSDCHKQGELINVYKARHNKMNDKIIEMEEESNKLNMFNEQGNFDTDKIKEWTENTIKKGWDQFKNFFKEKSEFVQMELNEKKQVKEKLEEEQEKLKKQLSEVEKVKALTNDELNLEIKRFRDELDKLENNVADKDLQIQRIKSLMIISSDDLRKIMKPKLEKLKASYDELKITMANQALEEVSEASSDDLLENAKWGYNMNHLKRPQSYKHSIPNVNRDTSSSMGNSIRAQSLSNKKTNFSSSNLNRPQSRDNLSRPQSRDNTGSGNKENEYKLRKASSGGINRPASSGNLNRPSSSGNINRPLSVAEEALLQNSTNSINNGKNSATFNRPPSHKNYKNSRPISAISRNSRFDHYNHSSAVSLTNINERSEFKSEGKIRFADENDLFDVEEAEPTKIEELKRQVEAAKVLNRELKNKINMGNEVNAEIDIVLSTCLNELRDGLHIVKVTSNDFKAIDLESKMYAEKLLKNIEIMTQIAKQVSKNPAIHLLKSEAKFKLADKYLDRYNLKSNYKANTKSTPGLLSQFTEKRRVQDSSGYNQNVNGRSANSLYDYNQEGKVELIEEGVVKHERPEDDEVDSNKIDYEFEENIKLLDGDPYVDKDMN